MAYCAAEGDRYDQDRTARSVNGEIVSESDSDSPEAYVGVSQPLSAAGKRLIAKKRAAIRRRGQEKTIAERHFLSRKTPK